jgi:anti-sigma factor RsiW
MTCGDVREILFAFLDNELDAALSIEVQRHMEHCPECASEVETERTIQRKLAAAMDRDASAWPTLQESLTTVVASPARSHVLRRLGVRSWIPITVGVAAVVILGLFMQRYAGLRTVSPQQGGLIDLLVADFDHFLTEGRPVQIASADRVEVSQWLHNKTGLEVSLPVTTGSRCKLIGGRKCTLKGQPAAFASYEMDASPTSLIVLAGGPDSIESLERVSRDGRTFWVDRCKGHSVVACLRDNLIYAAVSRTDKDELIHFMSELE